MSKFLDFIASRMIPEIDALPFDQEQMADLGQDWKEQAYPHALGACDILKPQFGGALQLYGIANVIRALIPALDLSRVCVRAGLVYASLDFFYTRQYPPTTQHFFRNNATAKKLPAYIRRRALDSVALSFAKIVSWLAVLQGIPEQWVPTAKISRHLEGLIRTLIKPAKLEVALDLHVPPGGREWLRRQSLAEFCLLQKDQCDRNPKAAALVLECSNQIEVIPVIVVQSCVSGARGIVMFFDPFFPQSVGSLSVDLQSGDLRFEVPSAYDIRGLMTMDFQARAPSISNFQKLWTGLRVASLTWRVSRLWRLAALRK